MPPKNFESFLKKVLTNCQLSGIIRLQGKEREETKVEELIQWQRELGISEEQIKINVR